jgi:D-serine deaminase-like pyridoxal phosphate-dependent protein
VSGNAFFVIFETVFCNSQMLHTIGSSSMTIQSLPTPALLLDIDILENNLRRMQQRAANLGVALRPHIKTHKCLEIAEWQRELGAHGITVSTLAEAEYFAAAGFQDITWAMPLAPVYISSALNLLDMTTLRVVIDSRDAMSLIERECWMTDRKMHVWLKVDCGYHRVGVDPSTPESLELARAMSASESIIFDGILTHGGHSYKCANADEIRKVAEEERSVMTEFADRLRANGITVPSVSVGSTPTMSQTRNLDGVTEMRPGNYAFYDYHQAAIGSCSVADCALTVLASVISHQPGTSHAVTDAGALALSKDAGPGHLGQYTGSGMIYENYAERTLSPQYRMHGLSQEHGIIGAATPDALEGKLKVGEQIRILENHSCLTAALFDYYFVVRGDEVVDRWKIFRERR